MEKSIVVVVERVKTHPLYKKRFVVKKKFYAHDE
jgi:ribosomal protein S17